MKNKLDYDVNVYKNVKEGFVENLKTAITESKFARFLSLAGAACAATNYFVNFSILQLGIGIGEVAGGYIIKEAINGNTPASEKTDQQLNRNLAKGAFLTVGSLALSGFASAIPAIGSYINGSVGMGGALTAVEAGIEKYKRRKM